MTVEQIKQELAGMPEVEQDHVVAYLVHLRHLRDPLAHRQITDEIDHRDPSHWVTLDELKEHWKE
jgi:hypothetical protein